MAPGLSRPMDDPDNYLPLARSLAEGRGFALDGRATAYRPPLYPIALAAGVAMLGNRVSWWARGLHLTLGAATVALTWLAARRFGSTPIWSLIAAAIVALDPALVIQSRSVMTETSAAFLLAAALAALGDDSPRGWSLGGLMLGLAALCRPSTLPAAALIAIASIAGPGHWRRRVLRFFLLVLATAAPLVPWAVRNARAVGEPVWTTTHGGFTLALANNPEYYAEVLDGPPGAVWSGPGQRAWQVRISRATAGLPEPEADRALGREAVRFMASRPRDALRASLARLGRFWGLAPAGSVYPAPLRALTALWTAPLWLAAAVGLARRDSLRWPRSAAPAMVLALTVVHALYWTDLRMRAPIVPAIALVAVGLGSIGRKNVNVIGFVEP